MPFVHSNGIKIYYEIQGEGRPLLVISGTGADLRSPRLPVPEIDNKFQIIRYDQRGLGQTETPKPPYTMEDYANDAAALVSSLDIGHTNVIGTSFGGMVAQHLAARHPRTVNKLVLACTSPGGLAYSSYDLRRIIHKPQNIQVTSWLKLLDSRYGSLEHELPILDAVETLLSTGKRIFPNNVTAGLLNQLEARSRHDAIQLLEKIPHSTLIIGGSYDLVAPTQNLQKLNDLIPNSELKLFDGGHLFMLQDANAWRCVASFLSED